MTLVMRPDGDGVAGGGVGDRRADGTGNIQGDGGARDNSDTDEEEEHFDISLAASHSVSGLVLNTAFLPQISKVTILQYRRLLIPFNSTIQIT